MKYGRKPPVHTRRTFRSGLVMARTLDALGAPPAASNDYKSKVTVPWQIFLNDTWGDCVCADTAHSLMLRTANTGTIMVPTDDDVLKLYEVVGGFDPSKTARDGTNPTDQGCDENAMCVYLENTGFLGHKSDATGTIEPSNLDHIHWCIQLFGACRIGINVPALGANRVSERPGVGSATGRRRLHHRRRPRCTVG